MDSANNLITKMAAAPDSSAVESLANELLKQYQRGSPLDSLRRLLASESDRLVDKGVWIASELGSDGKPLLPDIVRLLGHRSKKARFWSIDCILLWAGLSNGYEVASVVPLVDDLEEAVRWKAMGFLALAAREQLEAAVGQLAVADPESVYLGELRWTLASAGADPDQISDSLKSPSSLRRKFAAAAAFRIAKTDPETLRRAARSNDQEIAQFAGDMLMRVSP
ncbi:MAG: hypothetical protein ABSH09_08950 [Bryobacteraceae bacterium]|jgi:hypothetical protein